MTILAQTIGTIRPKNKVIKLVIINLFVALGYVACAYFGLKLAIPPGYATAVWVPSGIALGACLVWGVGCLPGVFLGSFFINLYITFLNAGDLMHVTTWLVGSMIALGALFQAWMGWFLIKKIMGSDIVLHHPKEILMFSLLSGPVSCMMNASWSNASLYLLGILSAGNIGVSWFTWWVGDCMGALIVTPIFLILFAKPREIWKERIIPVLVPLMISFFLIILIFIIVENEELNRVKFKFKQNTLQYKLQLKDWILDSRKTARALKAYLSSTQKIEKKGFQQFAQTLIQDNHYIQALEWSPLVKNITQFERKYGIKMKFDNQEAGKAKNQYFPVLYVYPIDKNQKAIGFDLSSNALRAEALKESLVGNETIMSSPITLLQSNKEEKGVLLFSPVYRNGKLSGTCLIVLNITKAFKNIFKELSEYDLITVSDGTNSRNPVIVYKYKNIKAKENSAFRMSHYYKINIGKQNQIWTISYHSSQFYINKEYSWQVWTVLVGGLFFCVLMQIILLILHGQKQSVQLQVNKQTKKLHSEEAKNLLLLQTAGEGIFGINIEGSITFVNATACFILGYREKELLDQSVKMVYFDTDKKKELPAYLTMKQGKVHKINEGKFKTAAGGYVWVECTCTPMKNEGVVTGAVVTFNDITQQRKIKMKLEKMAHYDALTGLPNRQSFLVYLDKALARVKRVDDILAVCFWDLDNFKTVNDNLGHNIGDKLLKTIPEVLLSTFRQSDYIARFSGDEFCLILEDIQSVEEISKILTRYLSVFDKAIYVDRYEINTSFSIGVAVFPVGGKSSEELIKNADIAMYKAKSLGKNRFAFFDEVINHQVSRKHQVEVALRQGIKKDEFYLLYQPQFDAKNRQLLGVEVLLRWENVYLHAVSPAEFIPIAEDCGLINGLGEWVLRRIVKDHKTLLAINPNMEISINISVRQLENPKFVSLLTDIIQQNNLNAAHLVIEITETAVMHHQKQIIDAMQQLHQLGLRFALDDFGMGYSSMSYLHQLPISYIKIDQSFVSGIECERSSAAIVKAIIQLSKALSIKTVAEGVETKGQCDFLENYECDYLQGYFFAKPMSLEALKKYKIK